MEIDTLVPTDPIADDTPIWRYMDLPKFVGILATGTLWFTKVATLRDDPYEGFCKATSIRLSKEEDIGPKWITHTGPEGTAQISVAEMLANFTQVAAGYCETAPHRLFVNSWCLAEESMAMWQIYGSKAAGIAIRSTVNHYRRAAKFRLPPTHYTFGRVEYHADITSCAAIQYDFTHGSIPAPGPALWAKILELGFHKRTCYEYEREWRSALYQDCRPDITGCAIHFELDELIEEVYVGPRAEPFLPEVVQSVMSKFDLRRPLRASSLLCPPQKDASASPEDL